MIKMKLDRKSVNNIKKKLKAMPAKLQKKAIRSVIDVEAKRIKNQFASITPIGKRKHKNKYLKRESSGFLKKSFSVRNSGRGDKVGRKIITRATGYYIHMSPNQTGRTAGSKRGHSWGAVAGANKYARLWSGRQRKVTTNLVKNLSSELGKI